MKNWTTPRRISFGIHVFFVSVPFLASSISALLLWQSLFNSWWLAVPAVLIVDILALTGLVLFILRVPSPFVPLRHALPFVSIVPLGRELYLLLAHNGPLIAVTVTVIAVTVLTAIAWKCFGTIESLFIPPVEAAREKAREQLSAVSTSIAQLTEANKVVAMFVSEWQGTPQPQTTLLSSVGEVPLSTIGAANRIGAVYVLRSENGLYKIGRAKNVEDRLRKIAAFVPFRVELIHCIQSDDIVLLERGLHECFTERRVHSEWFALREVDISMITSLGTMLSQNDIEDALEFLRVAVSLPTATITDDRRALPSKTAQVKALAAEEGISISTAWRKVKSGELSVEES